MGEHLLEQILDLEKQIKIIKDEQNKLSNKLKILQSKKDDLESQYKIEKIRNRPDCDEWINKQFQWSDKIKSVLSEVFKFNKFRDKQLAAINATLAKKDVLLLMPTGGGKSLVYQLPAIVESGITLVVSPLISLIEDQLIALEKFGIKAASINGSTSKEDKKYVHSCMTDSKKGLKLLFVTPEWVAKSKQFMSYLTKCFAAKLLNRIAIDEVHCCSTWGHDFRPEYNYLGLLKPMFPGVPFLGLTATATMSVLLDVQQMLGMEDCTIITAPFNRPNLYYEVIQKSQEKEDCIKYVEKLLKNNFRNQSGIIYTLTVKETEELASDLRSRGLKVGCYHAQLEPQHKKKIHQKWLNNSYQAVVATIAFGMGIDKPDVRFIIHYTIPKSMEGLYQESGRAGRDGEKAHCILMFSVSDYLKISGMASSKVEEKNVLSVLEYCMESSKCRRSLIAAHFEEVWESNHCNKMCDHCKNVTEPTNEDITSICKKIGSVISKANQSENKLTLLKLTNLMSQVGFNINKMKLDRIIAYMILKKYLKIEKGFNMYTVNTYLQNNHLPESKVEMSVINISDVKNSNKVFKRQIEEVIDLVEDDLCNKKSKG